MTERIEFGSKAAADQFRDEYADHLCSDDDRRLKTVAISSSAPDHVLETATIEASDSQADRDGSGQLPLEDHEIESIDWSKGRANVPWARSVKAVMRDEGVDDWLAYLDPSLTVDEHRDVAKRATRDEQGDRLDAETSVDEQLASVASFRDEQCGHAATHCEEGDDDACGFLVDECDIDEDEVQSLLSDFEEEIPEDEISDKWLGALKRAWTGYHNATDTLEAALEEATEAINYAVAAARAINGVRRAHGQDEIEEFRDLERLQRPLVWDPTEEIVAAGDTDDLESQETTDSERDGFERDIGQWEYEAGDDDQPAWRLERDRMDGGELLVTVTPNDRGRFEHIVGNLDELERQGVGEFPTREEALESAVSWMERHPDGIPGEWFRTDDRPLEDDAAGETLFDHAVNEPDEGDDTASREFRAAQQDGYLRQSESDGVDEREGLGQFGARRSDTKALEEFERDT